MSAALVVRHGATYFNGKVRISSLENVLWRSLKTVLLDVLECNCYAASRVVSITTGQWETVCQPSSCRTILPAKVLKSGALGPER